MIDDTYPVLEERTLGPVARIWFRSARREIADLPAPRPGAVLVFDTGVRWEVPTHGAQLTGREEAVVDAVAVSVVDRRERVRRVVLEIPSKDPADDFTVEVYFRCQVTDPAVVAEAGLTDLDQALGYHLRKDATIGQLGLSYTVDQLNTLRPDVEARLRARHDVEPPEIPGMRTALVTVAVQTPESLRTHLTALRDHKWQAHLSDLRQAAESNDVDRLSALFERGPDVVAALGVSRGEISTAAAANHAYAAHERRQNLQLEYLKMLFEDGHLDKVWTNGQEVVDTFAKDAFGVARDDYRDAVGQSGRATIPASVGDRPEIVSEADLDR